MKEQNEIIPDQKKLFQDYLRPIAALGLALAEMVCVIKVTILHQGSNE